MMKAGSMMISYQPLGELPNFFRSIISNQAQTEADVDFMLEELDRLEGVYREADMQVEARRFGLEIGTAGTSD